MIDVDVQAYLTAAGLAELPDATVIGDSRSGALGVRVGCQPGLDFVTDSPRWLHLFDWETSRTDSSGEHGKTWNFHVLVSDIPQSAWDVICAEPSNVKRIEIARRARDDAQLAATTPTRWAGGEIDGLRLPRGSLSQDSSRLVLRWFTSGHGGYDATFTGSTRFWTWEKNRTLITPIVVGLSDAQCDEIGKCVGHEDRIAKALSFCDPQPTAHVNVVEPEVSADVLRELRSGLTPPGVDGFHAVDALLEPRPGELNGGNVSKALVAAGIKTQWTALQTRQTYIVSYEGWPDAEHVKPTSLEGLFLESMSYKERVNFLLRLTQHRRMFVHLHRHRGVVRRLCTWVDRPEPTHENNWADLLYRLGLVTNPKDVLGKVFDVSTNARGAMFGASVESGADQAMTTGRVLDAVADCLWRNRWRSSDRADGRPGAWLEETDGVQISGFPSLKEVRTIVARAYDVHLHEVRAKVVLASEPSTTLAPVGLRTFDVPSGRSLLVEVGGKAVGTLHQARALLERLLRPDLGLNVRAVFLAHADAPGRACVVRREPGEPVGRGPFLDCRDG